MLELTMADIRRSSMASLGSKRSTRRGFMDHMILGNDEDEPPALKKLNDSICLEKLSTNEDMSRHSDDLVKELLPLEHGFKFIAPSYLAKIYVKLMWMCFQLGLANYGYDLLNMVGFYITAQSGNPEEQGAFGLFVFFNMVLIFGIFYAIDEKVGLSASLAYSENKFSDAKKAYWHGILSVCILTCFYFGPILIFAESIILGLGIEQGQAKECAFILRILFPVDIARMLNEVSLTFALAQGVTNRFGLISAINMVVSAGAGLLAYQMFDLGIYAWLVSRIVHEIIMFLMMFESFKNSVDPRTKGWPGLKEASDGLLGFLRDSGKFIVSLYSEWIGLEMAVFFTGLTHDPVQIAAYTSLANIVYFMFNTGLSFGTIGRTRINILLGKGYHNAARNFFIFFLVGSAVTAMILSGCVLLLRPALVYLYGGENQEVRNLLWTLLGLYVIYLPVDFLSAYLTTSARLTGQTLFASILTVGLLIGYCGVMDYIIVFVKHMTCIEIVTNMYITLYFIFGLLIVRLLRLNWSKICPEDDE